MGRVSSRLNLSASAYVDHARSLLLQTTLSEYKYNQ